MFGLYGWLFGESNYRGFFFNIGRGFVWPTIIFPALGQIIGGIILVVVIIAVLIFVRKKPD
jgi:formate/nitrite transporter FocA (FNT family)